MGKAYCVGIANGGNCPSMHRRDVRVCWRCDKCPKRDGFRLQKGDYCPTCVRELKALGYVWSKYYMDYVTPDLAAEVATKELLVIR